MIDFETSLYFSCDSVIRVPFFLQGQAVCTNYIMYGLCKFGPTCRFDHPFVGYSYNYGLSLHPPSVLDSSVLAYPRTPPTAHSSETSSMSSKVPDWTRSPDGSNKHQNSEAKKSISPPERADSPPSSLQSSAEPSHEQSG